MKSNLRRLHLLFKFTRLNPDMFYSISVTESGIYLQGKFNGELVNQLKKYLQIIVFL